MRSTFRVLVAAVVVLGLIGAEASASMRTAEVPSRGPGPAEFDSVNVHKLGPKDADRVLVLTPGTAGGAGNFNLIAKDLVDRVDGLAVWATDRRSQALEDTSRFEAALEGDLSLEEMWNYYLGWISNGGSPADHFDFLDPASTPFAKRWGLKVAVQDLRKVVKQASSGGERAVLLGGHSLGASVAAQYTAWDFNGRPGFRGLDGLVMIDGGPLGRESTTTPDDAAEALASLEGAPFLDLLGIGIPEASGLFAEAGAIFARLDPTGDGSLVRDFPLLPSAFKTPAPATNQGNLGHAFDRDTAPESLGLLHVNSGALADSGTPLDWVDGGVTPIQNVAEMFGNEPANGVEWYFPRRLAIDTGAASQMKRTAAARFLGLKVQHTRRIDIPIYAFQTDLEDGRVLAGASELVDLARTKPKDVMLVDGAPEYSHLDPLAADSDENLFTRTVAKFIRRATSG